MNPATATQRRVEALELRIRLERVAVTAFDHVCQPGTPGRNSVIGKRLAFVLGCVPEARRIEAVGLVRLGRHVYAKTSDVLHGRASAVNLPQVVVDEWRAVVERLEALVAARG
ncbi:hypothetical protein N8J89_30680 [Crossiella sp. CA-258035]|uniref:hypothetical protein n=1 Tax=Crossiella sp. CA-258035 TaxID=2981138 RepID=UPI0024BD5ACC|nr:hypothetical protein [Crossiella sp. CA-258035]WHT17466.1 hypothetical protein N8J89_30680 [Crossiella sp. CA-258035]